MKKNLQNSSINININKDDDSLNDFLYCWDKFGSRPNKILIHNTYSTRLFKEVFSKYDLEKTYFTEIIPSEESLIINDQILVQISESIYASYVIVDRNHESSIITEIIFFYKKNEDFEEIQGIVKELNNCIVDFESESNKMNTISVSTNGIELEPVEIYEFDIDNFELYYNKKTYKEINKLVKDIKKSDKGISILYGERGTGKTSIINYLSSKLDRIVIFIPNNLVDQAFNSPEFRKFLKRYYKPIIIIDDCETLFNDNYSKSNLLTNNLLQLVDGYMSDNIEVNIIAIFNTESEDEIDHVLLESNNLLKVVEFDYLSEEESNELSDYVGHNKKYKNKMRVLDIIKNNKPKHTFDIGL